jgi:hypothetical protein
MQFIVSRAFQTGKMVIAKRQEDGSIIIEDVPLDAAEEPKP